MKFGFTGVHFPALRECQFSVVALSLALNAASMQLNGTEFSPQKRKE